MSANLMTTNPVTPRRRTKSTPPRAPPSPGRAIITDPFDTDPFDTDPFDTAAIREAVLTAWAASSARFREDANAEELLARDYGTGLIGELAANGADAARLAGAPGELAIDVVDRTLRVANTGAPLDQAGISALASLRASAKRDVDAVGHFGVGFTAVVSATDNPIVASTTGAVEFSAAETARAVAALDNPALTAELNRRDGRVPVLRLPWPADVPPPIGAYTTEVRLPLRGDVDADVLAGSLTVDLAMSLLWALPDLQAVTVRGYRVRRAGSVELAQDAPNVQAASIDVIPARSPFDRDDGQPGAPDQGHTRRFWVSEASGVIPEQLVADLPIEQRSRRRWRLAWVTPLEDEGHPAAPESSAVGAPTRTDDTLALPAGLVATLPVDEGRRRVTQGPVTDYLVEKAAEAYARLVAAAPPEERVTLLPRPGFPLGQLDASMSAAIRAALERAPFLCDAAGREVTPAGAMLVVGVSGPTAARAAEAMPGLLAWPGSAADVERLRGLGVRVEPLGAVTAALAGLQRPTAFWQGIYDGLADMSLDDLADLPIPRPNGGTFVGARDVLLPPASGPVAEGPNANAGPGADAGPGAGGSMDWVAGAARLIPRLRLAAEGADHPLLRRLGARSADTDQILLSDALRVEIRRRIDDLDAGITDVDDRVERGDFAALIFELLRRSGYDSESGAGAGDAQAARLGEVILTDADGEPWPAAGLLLPDAPVADLLDTDADVPIVGSDWVQRYGTALLQRLGVRSGFAVAHHGLPPGDDEDLADVDIWWDETDYPAPGSMVREGRATGAADDRDFHLAISDLDLIDASRWAEALAMILADPRCREALHATAFGRSYSAWYVRRHARLDGVPIGQWRNRDAADLIGLYDEIPIDVSTDVAAELGILRTLGEAAAYPEPLLDRWADPARSLAPYRVPAVTAALTAALVDTYAEDVALPEGVRTLTGSVIEADRAMVLDHPMFAGVLDPAVLIAGGPDPSAAAEVFDVPLASQACRFAVDTGSAPTKATTLADLPSARRCAWACHRPDLLDEVVVIATGISVRAADRATIQALMSPSVPPMTPPSAEPARTEIAPTEPAPAERAVSWWADDDRIVIDGSPESIGRIVAWLAGRWADRHWLAALARADPADILEAGLDG